MPTKKELEGQVKTLKEREKELKSKARERLRMVARRDSKLEEYRTAYKRLDTNKHRSDRLAVEYQEKFQNADEKLGEIQGWLEKLKAGPMSLNYLVELNGPHAIVTGARMDDIARVPVQPNKEMGLMGANPGLNPGDGVWISGGETGIIMERAHFKMPENTGRVIDVFDEKAIIEDGGRNILLKAILPDTEVGDIVSYLPIIRRMESTLRKSGADKLLMMERPNVRWDMIGGLDAQIARIRDILELPLKAKDVCMRYDLRMSRGTLLHGPPGCGKTLLAKALATELEATFFNVTISDILSKWVGESEAMMKALFKAARKNAPAIVFIDEFDAMGTVRGEQDTSGVHKNIVAQMLSEMDGLEKNEGVIVFAATNRPDMVDPALLRPGRFDELVKIPRPQREAAEVIFRIHLPDTIPTDATLSSVSNARKAVLDHVYDSGSYPKKDIALMISGAFFEGLALRAKRKAVRREVYEGGTGLSLDDVTDALDEMLREGETATERVIS